MTGTTKDPEAIIATLFLEKPAQPDVNRMIERLGKEFEIDSEVNRIPVDRGFCLTFADGDLLVGMPVDAPYPVQIDYLYPFVLGWPDVAKDISRNQAYLMVTCGWSKLGRFKAHLNHTAVIRDLIEQLPVIGVLWNSALTSANNFKTHSSIPMNLWVQLQFTTQPNGNILISTNGMEKFGHMEIETESTLSLEETYYLVERFALYLNISERPVKDGDTFVNNEGDQPIKVRYTRSFRPDVNENVYWLELAPTPSVKKPRGFFSNLFGSDSKQ